MSRTVFALAVIFLAGAAYGEELDLLADPGAWTANVDRDGPTVTSSSTDEALLVADVVADGGAEDYPKLRLRFDEPQDWSRALRLRSRLRVTGDPAVVRKRIAFVFYDDTYRHADLPGNPPVQQIISHELSAGSWVNFRDSLVGLHRSAIIQLDAYIYELPPADPHSYRWEIAELALETIEGEAVVFDGEVFDRAELAGDSGEPIGTVATADGLAITLGEAGGVTEVRLADATVGAAAGRVSGLLVRDAYAGGAPMQVGGTLTAEGVGLHQQATLESLGLRVDATWRSIGEGIEIAGTIADMRGEDRAVTVYLALPLGEGPWRWWDDSVRARSEAGQFEELAHLETGALFGHDGRHSRYPLGCADGPGGGLTLAIRMDEPVVHRIALSPDLRTLYLALDFGLVPVTNVHGRSLAEAPFRALIYRHDPAWGMRSAMARYRTIFPQFFPRRFNIAGAWYVWGDVQEMPEALEAGFRFHWGPRDVDTVRWDDAHDVASLLYIEPEMYQQSHGELDRAPTLEEGLARLTRLAAGDPEEMATYLKLAYSSSYLPANWIAQHSRAEAVQAVARAAQASLQEDAGGVPWVGIGQYPWIGDNRWGVIFPCNLDPDIPEGKGWFCRELFIESGLQMGEEASAHYDGIGLDSLGGYGQTARVDYRREHFAYADIPLSFSASDRRPVIVSSFATIEWLSALAEAMHARGLMLMANCSWGQTPAWLTFAGPYLDVFGAEAATFADPDFIRFVAGRRPCSSLPYNPRPEWEAERHLLHGIWPGHGSDTAMMARLDPVLRRLDTAGWEPLTGVRAEPATVQVERYGGVESFYLTVHNPTPEAVEARLAIDVVVLGDRQWRLEGVYGPEPETGDDGAIRLRLGPQQTAVLSVSAD